MKWKGKDDSIFFTFFLAVGQAAKT